MTISYWLNESGGHEKLRYDAILIGGGIAGLSTAYWLEKKDPSLKIAIIEKHAVGFGASGRNAGFVTAGSAEHFNKLINQFGFAKATVIWNFSEKNRELLLSEIIQDQAADVDFETTGSCTVAASEADWLRYGQLSKEMRRAGIDVELINESQLSQSYGVRGCLGAIQYKFDGAVHPIKLLQKIKSKLKRTTFHCGEEVFKITDLKNSVEIATQKKNFVAGQVFICLNAFVSQLLPEFKNRVKPQRGQALMTEPLPLFIKGPCYLTKHLCYFRQLPTGEVLVGGFRNCDMESENTAVDETTETIQSALTNFTQNYFQNTQAAKIQQRWSGIMGFTKDEQMLVGAHPERKNIFVMAGCSGHGMGLSFHAARVLAGVADGATVPAHLDIQRFFQ